MQEVALIVKKAAPGGPQFEICREGLALLRTLRTKKLRIIFNITHQQDSLNTFNSWLFGGEPLQEQTKVRVEACLTVSKHVRELEEERVILILNAFEKPEEQPLMVLLGYLASSVFMYHSSELLSEQSPLTAMLQRLKALLAATDIVDLNREMKYKKGYSKNPHFLCLLPVDSAKQNVNTDPFKEFYRYRQGGNQAFNQAVDALIDFLPERSSLPLVFAKEQVSRIGKQFEETVLGREIFNFQFTGSTLENLCFECCQAFNSSKPLNLSLVYSKIIENQKCRLEDEASQRYMKEISVSFFNGGKVDFKGSNSFPFNSAELVKRERQISQDVLDQTVKLASYCMNLPEYQTMHQTLRKKIRQMQNQMEEVNSQKNEDLCRQCFEVLENIDDCEINSLILNDLFREVENKFELYIAECSEAIGKDVSFKIFTYYLGRLQSNILEKLRSSSVSAFQDYQLKIQQNKVEKQDLKYSIRILQSKLRELQYEYNLQEDILNQYKMKLIYEPEPMQQSYSSDLNKFRKRIQELEEEVQDKDLYIQELEGILERFEGLATRERLKYKFSKQIVEMVKEVSNDLNNCHTFIKEAKKTNELYEQIKEGFTKERQSIAEQRKKALQDIISKEAQFQKVIKQKAYLQQVINEARQSIQVYKQVDETYKEGISHLESTYTQAQCLLAETENQLELYKKAISLAAEQQIRGNKLEALNNFYKVANNPKLKQLLRPFLKK